MGELQAARADEARDGTVYVVSYLEVMPRSASEAAALLQQYREASGTEDGYERLEVLQQSGRPDHFAVVELWRDQRAFEAHTVAAHSRHFREALRSLWVSPYDERPHTHLASGPMRAAHAPGGINVVTHVDTIPSAKDDAIVLLKQLVSASCDDDGGVCFEVLQQRSRQNHFSVVEVWRDQQAFEAHAMATHTRQFREQFQPMSGSLYDERLYQALD
jgi:quinol monooxygenase YgiN